MHLTHLQNKSTTGDIEVKVCDSTDTKVDLKANNIELDDQLHIDGSAFKDTSTATNQLSGNCNNSLM